MVIHKELQPRTYFFTQMRILSFFALLLFCGVQSFAQCDSKFSITEKKEALPGQHTAAVGVRVESAVQYTVKLISQVDETREVVEKKYSSKGNQTFRFEGLSADKLYKVTLEFESDTRAICKKRATEFFELNKNKD